MRTETVVIEFKTNDAFREFWNQYGPAVKSDGFQTIACGTGNHIKKADRYQQLLGIFYDAMGAAFKYFHGDSMKVKCQAAVLKLVNNVLDEGDFSDERYKEIGGSDGMYKLEQKLK
jgi:hypothetical protein